MNRFAHERLMTIEEAQRLCDPSTSREAEEQRRRMWAWQSVEGVLSQTIDDETLDRMERLAKQR